jgi:hypothetical protein
MVRKYLQDARAWVARLLALVIARVVTFDAVARKRASRIFAHVGSSLHGASAAMYRVANQLRGWPAIGGGADDDDDDADKDKSGDDDKDDDDSDADADADADKDKATGDDDKVDWKQMARKHERRAKKEKERADKLAADQKKADEEQKSDLQKAIDAAREEGKTAALTEAQKERRADRLENSVIRLAAKGVTVGEGDEAKTLKFDDPEDALTFIERAIAKGDLDEEDIFDDDGKVKTDAVEDELVALLKRKPKLAAENGTGTGTGTGDKGRRQAGGSGDGGKGGKGGGKSLDEMSPEEHLAQIKKG